MLVRIEVRVDLPHDVRILISSVLSEASLDVDVDLRALIWVISEVENGR